MGNILVSKPKSIGTSDVQVLAANQNRSVLLLQNRHATQTVRVKFGGAVQSADVTEVQKVSFSAVPDAGSFKLVWNSILSTAIAFGDNAAAVQTALRTISGLGSVTVAGSFAAGFDVTFTGATPSTDADLPLLTVSANSLTLSLAAVDVTVAETTKGLYADGYLIPAANGTLNFVGDDCPIDSVHMLASGADTRVEVQEG